MRLCVVCVVCCVLLIGRRGGRVIMFRRVVRV